MSDNKVHMSHCFQGEYYNSCKYGESMCPCNPNNNMYKKGTKVRLYCCTHDAQSTEHDDIILDEDTSETTLNEMARDFMYNTKEPEYWFEVEE